MNIKNGFCFRVISCTLSAIFSFSLFSTDIFRLQSAEAAQVSISKPATLLELSNTYSLPVLRGLKLDLDNPFNLDFIIDTADQGSINKDEASKLVKYFLAGLTTKTEDIWVNLSPYEKDRITSDVLAETDLGKDLLEQDYILKQLSASLTFPETEIGKKYWANDAANSDLSKIWISPDLAQVYENANTVLITKATLKVDTQADSNLNDSAALQSLLPAVTIEVNNGKNFSNLRQIYHSLVLADWFKAKLRNSFFKHYIDQGKTAGIDINDPAMKEKIWSQYYEAFQKGAYDYIKKEKDPYSGRIQKKKYFSGGFGHENKLNVSSTKPNENSFLGSSSALISVNLDTNTDRQVNYKETASSAIGHPFTKLGRAVWTLKHTSDAEKFIDAIKFMAKNNKKVKLFEILEDPKLKKVSKIHNIVSVFKQMDDKTRLLLHSFVDYINVINYENLNVLVGIESERKSKSLISFARMILQDTGFDLSAANFYKNYFNSLPAAIEYETLLKIDQAIKSKEYFSYIVNNSILKNWLDEATELKNERKSRQVKVDVPIYAKPDLSGISDGNPTASRNSEDGPLSHYTQETQTEYYNEKVPVFNFDKFIKLMKTEVSNDAYVLENYNKLLASNPEYQFFKEKIFEVLFAQTVDSSNFDLAIAKQGYDEDVAVRQEDVQVDMPIEMQTTDQYFETTIPVWEKVDVTEAVRKHKRVITLKLNSKEIESKTFTSPDAINNYLNYVASQDMDLATLIEVYSKTKKYISDSDFLSALNRNSKLNPSNDVLNILFQTPMDASEHETMQTFIINAIDGNPEYKEAVNALSQKIKQQIFNTKPVNEDPARQYGYNVSFTLEQSERTMYIDTEGNEVNLNVLALLNDFDVDSTKIINVNREFSSKEENNTGPVWANSDTFYDDLFELYVTLTNTVTVNARKLKYQDVRKVFELGIVVENKSIVSDLFITDFESSAKDGLVSIYENGKVADEEEAINLFIQKYTKNEFLFWASQQEFNQKVTKLLEEKFIDKDIEVQPLNEEQLSSMEEDGIALVQFFEMMELFDSLMLSDTPNSEVQPAVSQADLTTDTAVDAHSTSTTSDSTADSKEQFFQDTRGDAGSGWAWADQIFDDDKSSSAIGHPFTKFGRAIMAIKRAQNSQQFLDSVNFLLDQGKSDLVFKLIDNPKAKWTVDVAKFVSRLKVVKTEHRASIRRLGEELKILPSELLSRYEDEYWDAKLSNKQIVINKIKTKQSSEKVLSHYVDDVIGHNYGSYESQEPTVEKTPVYKNKANYDELYIISLGTDSLVIDSTNYNFNDIVARNVVEIVKSLLSEESHKSSQLLLFNQLQAYGLSQAEILLGMVKSVKELNLTKDKQKNLELELDLSTISDELWNLMAINYKQVADILTFRGVDYRLSEKTDLLFSFDKFYNGAIDRKPITKNEPVINPNYETEMEYFDLWVTGINGQPSKYIYEDVVIGHEDVLNEKLFMANIEHALVYNVAPRDKVITSINDFEIQINSREELVKWLKSVDFSKADELKVRGLTDFFQSDELRDNLRAYGLLPMFNVPESFRKQSSNMLKLLTEIIENNLTADDIDFDTLIYAGKDVLHDTIKVGEVLVESEPIPYSNGDVAGMTTFSWYEDVTENVDVEVEIKIALKIIKLGNNAYVVSKTVDSPKKAAELESRYPTIVEYGPIDDPHGGNGKPSWVKLSNGQTLYGDDALEFITGQDFSSSSINGGVQMKGMNIEGITGSSAIEFKAVDFDAAKFNGFSFMISSIETVDNKTLLASLA